MTLIIKRKSDQVLCFKMELNTLYKMGVKAIPSNNKSDTLVWRENVKIAFHHKDTTKISS